jgi:hypothetical protein
MPYIKQHMRDELDPFIDAFAKKVKEIHEANPVQTRDGLLNYSITRILNQVFADAKYHDLNEVIGMLECCKLEYYRVYGGPYEDLKQKENGPVEVFNKGENTGY